MNSPSNPIGSGEGSRKSGVGKKKSAGKQPNPNYLLNEMVNDGMAPFFFHQILHLGLMLTDEADLCEPIREFVENELGGNIADSLKAKVDLSRVLRAIDDQEDTEAVLSEFAWSCKNQQRWGFLCCVYAPETTKLPGGGKLVSRGVCRVRWFYGEDLPEVIRQAEEWAVSQEKSGPMPKFVRGSRRR